MNANRQSEVANLGDPSATPALAKLPATEAPDFDRLAGPYRWLEYLSFGPLLQRTRTHFLSELAASRHALVLGDGDGRFTADLLRANAGIRIHAVDTSPAMLRALTRRARPNQLRLSTEQADLRLWQPNTLQAYDLIVTHFFLDCLSTEEVASLAARLKPALTPAALWVVSDFATPPTRFGRLVAGPLVSLLYRAFRLLTGLRPQTLPDHAAALTASGWTMISHRTRLRGLLLTQLWRHSSPCIPRDSLSVS